MMRWLSLVLCLLAGAATAQERPTVAAVNYPLAYFAERLGGDAVEVLFDVPAGSDPSFWRPGLAEISAIQSADLIALNGAGFANWITKVSLPRSRLVETSAKFADDLIATQSITHSHGADGEHSHTGTASYTWLDFDQAALQAEALAQSMTRRLPGIDGIDERLAALTVDLETLDETASRAADALGDGTVLATHPRYQYFARAYDLDIVSLEWEAGETPNAEQWSDLSQRVEETGATVLIWEAAPSAEALETAAGLGLRNIILPPLAVRPSSGDFISEMTGALALLSDTDG